MTDAVVAGGVAARKPIADSALGAAAALWFFVTLIGQWVFLYYLVAFYGPGAMSGDFASWNRHPMIDHPFVPGDIGGNIAFAAHILFAVIIILGGTLQLVPQIRRHAPALHRWNGRVFVVCAMLAALAGLYMVWIRDDSPDGGVDDIIISGNAVLILLFGALAWAAGMARNIASHRRWALRMFMVTNGVFWLRLGFSAWILLTQSQPSTLTFYLFTALSYLLPLAVLEIYLRAKDSGAIAKVTAAGIVFASSVYIALGIFGFYMIFVQRILGAA
ncbi:MAG: DUF2306 domain-containing protein [Caulobacteraceae bacterium]